jgi:hypothetical protein
MRRRRMHSRLQTIAGSLLIVTVVSACESWGPAESVTSPSNDPALTASIYVPIVSTNGATPEKVPFIPFRCASGLRYTGPLDIAMTAGDDVNLNKVRIRLVTTSEQSSSGASTKTEHASNTFDEDDLKSAFGSTQIPGGTVRTFRFRTDLACGQATAEFVAADIQFTEKSGRRNTITVTAPFESAIDVG